MRPAGAAVWGAALSVALLTMTGTGVIGETGFSPVATLRTGPEDAIVGLEDIAASGANVAVLWTERRETASVLRVRTSIDGGRTFRAQRRIRDARGGASSDVCGGMAWVAHNYGFTDEPSSSAGLVVDGLPLAGDGGSREVLVRSGGPQYVDDTDLACVETRRRVVAWVDRDHEATSTVRIRFLPFPADPERDGPAPITRAFSADPGTGVALASTGHHVWLAWQAEDERIRIRRFDIGPGPEYRVSARPAVTLPDAGSGCCLVLAASGSRVVIAYTRWTEQVRTFARVSTDGGSTFGPRHRLIDAGCSGCDGGTAPMSADLRGSRLVVHADHSGIDGGTSYRFASSDDGRSWKRASATIHSHWMGAFTALGGKTRLVEAWDERGFLSPPDGRHIWFHRER